MNVRSPLYRYLLAICLSIATTISVHAQITVYTQAGDDSTERAVQLLFSELNKAGIGKFNTRPAAAFNGKGLLVLKTEHAVRNKINVPSQLLKYGEEGIYIKGSTDYAIIIGNTGLALQEAVYFYLEQLGFRYLMPGKTWEEVPAIRSVYKTVNILTQPDFDYRDITNGHGYYNKKNIENDFAAWSKANRLGGAFPIMVGHSYDEIVLRNAEVFKKHPEYFAGNPARGSLPENPKFNVANKELVDLVVNDAIRRFEYLQGRYPGLRMISMEPSDGLGFCTTAECNAIGSPSDQAFYLSNKVNAALRKKYPYAWVGGLAYSAHIVPPKIKLEPNTFVMVTTAFNSSGFSTEELLYKWKEKGASKSGVYDYLSVYEWDFDLPGQVAAAQPAALQQKLKKFHKAGARAYLGESVMGWVNRGPGQYILSRLLWNRNVNIDSLKKDFYEKAFGNVAPIMRRVYDNWEYYPHRIAMNNDLAIWLAWTDEAYRKANSGIIKNRINAVKTYLHYVVMYRELKMNPTEANMRRIMSFAYRNFENPAFATLPTLVSLPSAGGFPKMGLHNGADKSYMNDDRPYSAAELEKEFQQDIKSIKRTAETSDFKKSKDFVRLNEIVTTTSFDNQVSPYHTYWGNTEFIIRVKNKEKPNWLKLSSGSSSASTNKPIEVKVYPANTNNPDLEGVEPLVHFKQEKKGVSETVSLESLKPGIYTVRVIDPMKMFAITFSPGIDYSIVLNASEKLLTTSASGLNNFFFYVPKGTKNFRMSKTVILKLKSPTGRLLDYSNDRDEVFDVEVKPGEEGIWVIYHQSGSVYIDGIPPYLGPEPSKMLVPSYLKK